PHPIWSEESAGDPVALFVHSILAWEAPLATADAAFEKLSKQLVDWNDLRVCLVDETMEIVGPRYPNAFRRLLLLRTSLTAIYKKHHEVDLRHLGSSGKREARAYMEALPEVPSFVAHRTLLVGFRHNVMPMDARLLVKLQQAGVVDPEASESAVATWIAKELPNDALVEAHFALHAFADSTPDKSVGQVGRRQGFAIPARRGAVAAVREVVREEVDREGRRCEEDGREDREGGGFEEDDPEGREREGLEDDDQVHQDQEDDGQGRRFEKEEPVTACGVGAGSARPRRHRSWTAAWRAGMAVVALLVAGCATTRSGDSAPDARTRLLAAAAAERPGPDAPAGDPSPPPNLAGLDLTRRPADDPQATMPLDEAIDASWTAHPEIRVPTPIQASGPGDDGDADEALRAYLRGRNAMLAGDFPQAVGEFERAHLLDPGEASILRQLGRAYSQAGNGPRAAEAFTRLRGLEPDDPEALFTIGMNAANRGRHAEAVAALARLQEIFADGEGDANLSTMVAVDFALASALLELGHDRAFLEMAEIALGHPVEELAARGDDPRVGEIYRRRSELAQAMGDAALRLGDAEAAVAHYRAAAELPVGDPAALRARLVHGLLVSGRPLAAQAELLASCESGAAGDAEIALAGHLLEAGVDVSPLVAAVEELGRRRPDEPEIVRVLARLDPDATVRILTELAAESAGADGVEQLLDWVERVDLASACAIAVDLAARNPDAIAPSAERLAASSGTPEDLRSMLAALPAGVGRTAIEAALLVALRDPASAWALLETAEAEQDHPSLLRVRALAAGAMADPMLVDRVEDEVRRAIEANTLEGLAAVDAERAVIEAHLAAGASEAAWDMLEARPIDPGWPSRQRGARLLLQSRAAAAESAVAVGGAADLLRAVAVRSAEAAVEADPGSVEAWEWMLVLRDPRSGIVPDAEAHRRALESMQAALAGESIVERLRAEQDLLRGRVDAALARLETVLEAHPGDAAALQAVVGTLTRAGRTGEILPRLDRRLAEAPADPTGWDIRVATLVQTGRAAEAEAELRELLEADPAHPFASGLLEALLRATGRGDEAETLAEARLDRRPETPGREIDRAMLRLERSGRRAAAARDEAAADEVVAASAQAVDAAAELIEAVPAMSRAERMRLLSIPLQASPDVRTRRETIASSPPIRRRLSPCTARRFSRHRSRIRSTGIARRSRPSSIGRSAAPRRGPPTTPRRCGGSGSPSG
ncbi:MAG: tetratricopeptide repeat protein, partial [Planctomycetota bacterium]